MKELIYRIMDNFRRELQEDYFDFCGAMEQKYCNPYILGDSISL